jgi:hypothetical protein
MSRTCAHCIVFAIILGLSLDAPFVTLGHAEGRIWLVGEPSQGMPTCEEFYDKWEVAGAPPAMMAMFGLGREVMAAKDCLDKGNITSACKHWQGLLVVMEKMGSPLDESRADVEALMHDHNCEAAPASESTPESIPGSDTAPAAKPGADQGAGPDAVTVPASPE